MKILKYLTYAISILLLLSVGSLVYMFLRLPSPQELAERIPGSKKNIASAQAPASDGDTVSAIPTSYQELENLQEKLRTDQKLTAEEQKKFDQLLGDEIFNYEKPISETCDNLSKAPSSDFLSKSFDVAFPEAFGKDIRDPFLQAILAPLKKATRFPKMKVFFKEVVLYKEQTKEAGLLNKAYFYGKAFAAVQEIKSRKNELNIASDRAYRMYVLTKAVQKKPELALDGSVKDFCYQLQNTIENTTDVDYEQENAEFLKFLNYAGLDSSDVDYDPSMRTDFKINLEGGSLQMGLGWIGKEMTRQ